jgi:ribosomal protein S18 acetylase RimI-like enzyme
MPPIVLRIVPAAACDDILPLLRDADEDEGRIRALVTDGMHTSYAAWDETVLVGAVVMRWASDTSEIEYIATAADVRGRGYGKAMIAGIFAEAQERVIQSILVGTGNNSWETIAFYQKCGFRMDHVRHNFFSYIQPSLVIDGIPLRDMLVLRYLVTKVAIR